LGGTKLGTVARSCHSSQAIPIKKVTIGKATAKPTSHEKRKKNVHYIETFDAGFLMHIFKRNYSKRM
jgi:hypothetical protein